MGSAFAHFEPQAQPWDHFTVVFDAVWVQSEEDSASLCDHRRNMDALVHSRAQETVKTVNFTRWTCSKKGEDCPRSRKGGIYWEEGGIYIDYLEKGKKSHRAPIRRVIESIRRRAAEKTVPFGKDKIPHHNDKP